MQCARSWIPLPRILVGLLALSIVWVRPATGEVFEDRFPGTSLNPAWTSSIPLDGALIEVSDGLQITLPGGPFDYWVGVGNSPEITLPAPSGDFVISAKINSIQDEFGDPLESVDYHAVLTVNFGGTDDFMWGAYRSNTHLVLERSGVNGIGAADVAAAPLWVQIKRTGNEYRFFYREKDTDAWTQLTSATGAPIVRSVNAAPRTVGLMFKTWGGGPAGVATFGAFTLETGQFTGTISGKVTTNGPSASRVSVQATNPLDGSVNTAPVASNGSYSLSLGPGQYDLRVVGSALASVGPETMKTGVPVKFAQTTAADFSVQLVPDLDPATAQVFEDDFAGTSLKPQWLPVTPKADAAIGAKGGLKLSVPDGAYDYWVGVADAPRAVLPAPRGDFTASARIVSATDSDGNPLEGANFHTTLIVNLGGTDSLMWGAYRSNGTLQLERSGMGGLGNVAIGGTPVWIQIKKAGNQYHFLYREGDSDPWQELQGTDGRPVVLTITQWPQEVGLQHKTWGAGVTSVGTFDRFRLEAVTLRSYGAVSGKVTTNGPSPTKLTVQAADAAGVPVASAPVAADGGFSLTLGDGTYTVSATSPALDPTQPAPSQAGVVVEGGKTATVNLSAVLVPDLNPSTNQAFTDDFQGTSIKPEWQVSIPVAGPTITQQNGLIFTLPAGAFDAWIGVANAPSVLMPAPPADFLASARLGAANDPTGSALEGPEYHSVITIGLGGTDYIYWGAYRSNMLLQLERSNIGNIGNVPIDGLPVSLQVTRTVTGTGSTYRFFHRQSDSDPWTELEDAEGNAVTITAAAPPVSVGLMQKTWGAGAEMTALWSSFRLEAALLRFYGTLSGKVTASGLDLATLKVQVVGADGTLVSTLPVSADGTYSGRLVPGTYGLRLIDSTPSILTTKSGVALPSQGSVTADLIVGGPVGVPGDMSGDGKFAITDVLTALRGLAGLLTPTAEQKAVGDVNKDGNFSITDVVLMLRVLAGLATFP